VPKTTPLQVVGLPSTFAELVASPLRHVTGEPLPELHGMEGTWMHLKGDPLPVPITIRIEHTNEGRFIVTGLVIGLRESTEITWETMRQIRLATVLEQLFAGYDPMNPAATEDASWGRRLALLTLWYQLPDVPVESKPRRHAARNLREVAETYLRHLAATPNRATAATAKELHCSRATVIRRLEEARLAGLLPSKESKK
jgi:hypothetical protein